MYKLILLGYMASGKTSVGEILAQQMQLPHIDLDVLIAKKLKMDIQQIFKQKGEIFFRKIEHETLIEVLNASAPIVLSLGGGTPCYANNHELLNQENVMSVYLKASIDTLVDRLDQSMHRPLIVSEDKDELKEFIAKHLFDRSFFYNKATHTVVVDNKPIEQIATEIMGLLT